MKLEELLDIEVTYFDKLWKEPCTFVLRDVFKEIVGEKHNSFTSFLRNLYQTGKFDNYKADKSKLPVITFCASFHGGRKKEHLKSYNSLFILDIDKLGATELSRVKQVLTDDIYTFSFWESPSGDGIKGLVYLKYDFNIHVI